MVCLGCTGGAKLSLRRVFHDKLVFRHAVRDIFWTHHPIWSDEDPTFSEFALTCYPIPKCSRGAVYTAFTLLRLYRYTATRRKYIWSVVVFCLCSAYTAPCSIPQCKCSVLQIPKSWQCKLTGYPSHGSVRYTACTVYTAATLYCWQWTCSVYCTPLHLYCTSVWDVVKLEGCKVGIVRKRVILKKP